jgi:hypothetical protein
MVCGSQEIKPRAPDGHCMHTNIKENIKLFTLLPHDEDRYIRQLEIRDEVE